jgi:hypothetical protein
MGKFLSFRTAILLTDARYIRVGSQYKAGCIETALADNRVKGLRADLYTPLAPPAPPGQDIPLQDMAPRIPELPPIAPGCCGLLHRPTSTTTGEAARSETTVTRAATPPDRALRQPLTWWGFDVRGDERKEGPIFNYGRIFTWFAATEYVEHGFNTAITGFRARNSLPATTKGAAECCGWAEGKDLTAFRAWSELPGAALKHMWMAALMALFLQWGTTGAAVFVAYRTPSVGIGCRSGSYLIYGIAATISWFILVLSHLLSHAAMQRLERNPDRKIAIRILGALAVGTRLLGKLIAICNAMWLVASSVMEDIGFFQTCWCQTDAYQYHMSGWTPVFKGQEDLRTVAQGTWFGGFIWSVVVCVIAGVFFSH